MLKFVDFQHHRYSIKYLISQRENGLIFKDFSTNTVIVCANLIIGQLAHRKVGQYQYN